MGSNESDHYVSAGVDYAALDRMKRIAQAEARSTAIGFSALGAREVASGRGETAFIVDIGDAYLATVIECLGTKSLVADAMRAHLGRSSYDCIARDTVAAVVNDVAAVGAVPLVVNAYFAVGLAHWFADDERTRDLLHGWAAACREAGAVWGGGESPALSGIIIPQAIDLAGSAVGLIRPKGRLVQPDRLRPGDAIVLVASSGIHVNGLSLARRVAAGLPRGWSTPLRGGRTFGEALLEPAPLYSNLVRDVQEAGVDIHYLVHVTGHGWRKLMRAERDLTYVIDRVPVVPEVLAFLSEAADLSDEEAYGVFNMGAGFAFYVAPEKAVEVVAAARHQGIPAHVAGHIEEGPRQVLIPSKGIEFRGESLQIR